MTTYTTTHRATDWASQSRVVHSGARMNGLNRWSVQVLRSRSRHNGAEKRGLTVFISCGRLRGEIGTR
jgi:hypothetical protein